MPRLRGRVAADLVGSTMEIVTRVEQVLAAAHDVEVALPSAPTSPSDAQADAIADIRAQLDRLLPPGFVTATGTAHLADLRRYLLAIGRRLERLPHAPGADRDRMQRVHAVQDAYDELVRALSPARAAGADVRDIGRQIEELRVSLWAQQLGTRGRSANSASTARSTRSGPDARQRLVRRNRARRRRIR